MLNVVKNAKFRSNLTEADPYTAENAILNEEEQEDIKLTKLTSIIGQQSFFSLFCLVTFHRHI